MAKKYRNTAALSRLVERPAESVAIDAIDRAILLELSADARLSHRALARNVQMSAPAVAERVARLERLGVIKGYAAAIDWDRLGYSVLVFVLIVLDTGNDIEPTTDALRAIEELEDLTVLAGRYDMIARFRLRDHAHVRELLLDRLWQLPNVSRMETTFGLGGIPLESLTARLLTSDDDERDTIAE
ncbi:Lrp/AsnC family transcriptional regulator [Microbacterium sp. ASV49]|uniref:Lrp/AsnC family transcriptional regulator n=1 Tax=Microbacterium candidum TaxID=3041922 RepID=A0ABT7MW53_9MICO|nr:Lrp/AsnC family transcriptional regulator [Microbacterium sp. ASV49]MDL9978685.1 Lrp/AsnC family transcriptional regulator [Microbacterium sp. ASV49]